MTLAREAALAIRLASPDATAEPDHDTVVVMVPDLRDEEIDEELVDAIGAQTAGGEVDVRFVRHNPDTFAVRGLDERSRRTAGEWAARSVLWVAVTDDDFELFVYDVETERVLRRLVPIEDGENAAAVEDLANIAGTVVSESSREGMTEVALEELVPQPEPKAEPKAKLEPTPEPAVKKVVPAAKPKFAQLWLAVFYAGNTFADAMKWQNGLGFSAAWAPVPGAFVGVRYDIVFPTKIATSGVVFDIRRHPIALVGGYRFQVATRVDVQVGAKVHVDPVLRHADGDDSAARVTGDALRVFSGGGGGIGVGFKPRPQIRLALDAGVDALFTRATYGVGPGDPAIVLAPHPARFTLDVGMHFGLVWKEH